jgi:hypothetical protein
MRTNVRIYEGGPDLETLHYVYMCFGITPTEFLELPIEEAKLYARFANEHYDLMTRRGPKCRINLSDIRTKKERP